MKSFVIFSCANQSYGVSIDYVKRILEANKLTLTPDEEEHIEGMFEYNNEVLKVVSFRKLLGQKTFTAQLRESFPELKVQHKAWLDALIDSVEEGTAFTKTTNPRACHLGKWIDSIHPENKEVVETLKHLVHHHTLLHQSAREVLALREECPDKAHEWIENNVQDIYKQTLLYLDKIASLSTEIAVDMEQCLILLDKNNEIFGMNIDKVEDIVHIEDHEIHISPKQQSIGKFLNVEGILELDGKLVTIIKDMNVF